MAGLINIKGNYFFIVPTLRGKCWGFTIWIHTPVGFSVMHGGAKSRVVTISLSPQSGAYTGALKSKSLSRPGGKGCGYK